MTDEPKAEPTIDPDDFDAQRALAVTKIAFAARHHMAELIALPMPIKRAVRQNGKRGAEITFGVPDEVVKNVNGKEEHRHLYLFVIVPRHVHDRVEAAAGDGVVLYNALEEPIAKAPAPQGIVEGV